MLSGRRSPGKRPQNSDNRQKEELPSRQSPQQCGKKEAFSRIDQTGEPEIRNREVDEVEKPSDQGYGIVSSPFKPGFGLSGDLQAHAESDDEQARGGDEEGIGAEQAKNSWVPAAQSSLGKVIERRRDPR